MEEKKYVMSLDQGTTSSRCIIFDFNGKAVAMAQREFPQIYPRPGWVEHNPKDILSSQLGVAAGALLRGGIRAGEIAAIGITNQRETSVIWDRRSGEPLCNAVVWQCRRTSDYCAELKKAGADKQIYAKTGLVTDAYFSASKIRWMLENVPGARAKAEAGRLCFGTVDSFLIWHLTRGRIHATDYTNASRTMLFNIHTADWDEDLLKLFGVPRAMLPEVFPSSHIYGNAHSSFLGAEIPVCGVAGDQQAALFGQLCFKEGDIKNTYGTGCFILMNTGARAAESQSGLITTLTAETATGKKRYALEGSVFVAGAAIQWLRDGLKLIGAAGESEAEALSVPDNGGVYFVPSFVGLGAPYWDSAARGVITGLTRGADRRHIIRAALESVAFQSGDVLKAMEKDGGLPIRRIGADGGASANNFLMQFQSDISGAEVVRPETVETTALGACYLAGLGAGVWKSADELAAATAGGRVFRPRMAAEERERLLSGWAAAVARARLQA